MKTLVIVAHPDFEHSATQQFLYHGLPSGEDVTRHHLDKLSELDVTVEQQLLREHDRIIFQFPLYWYSTPTSLRNWQDQVLTQGFAFGAGAVLNGKEFGIVVSFSDALREYQAGGQEQYTISEILRPLQAMAHKLGWQYRTPLMISQFAYKNDEERLALIMEYQRYLTQAGTGFAATQEWYLAQLATLIAQTDSELAQAKLEAVYEQMLANRDDLTELHWTVDMIKNEEEGY
ncbi:flavodoxin family protein [Periweissella cryptocerci]|uniref:Flavodoxin family protein n=1 Tax=Periweissella cryptocerci TaxID=2506420 RepID=A0A4P6YTU9_9LACO|nr:NAD(P)H-dependent oxidoreductase [Periweissella cryptocerci]QBO36188.1 flavodoxin family protein [Periweissella cryptocerci]